MIKLEERLPKFDTGVDVSFLWSVTPGYEIPQKRPKPGYEAPKKRPVRKYRKRAVFVPPTKDTALEKRRKLCDERGYHLVNKSNQYPRICNDCDFWIPKKNNSIEYRVN